MGVDFPGRPCPSINNDKRWLQKIPKRSPWFKGINYGPQEMGPTVIFSGVLMGLCKLRGPPSQGYSTNIFPMTKGKNLWGSTNSSLAGKWGTRIEPMILLMKLGIFQPALLVCQRVISFWTSWGYTVYLSTFVCSFCSLGILGWCLFFLFNCLSCFLELSWTFFHGMFRPFMFGIYLKLVSAISSYK